MINFLLTREHHVSVATSRVGTLVVRRDLSNPPGQSVCCPQLRQPRTMEPRRAEIPFLLEQPSLICLPVLFSGAFSAATAGPALDRKKP